MFDVERINDPQQRTDGSTGNSCGVEVGEKGERYIEIDVEVGEKGERYIEIGVEVGEKGERLM